MMHFQTSDSLPWRKKRLSKISNDFRVQRVVRAYDKGSEHLVDEFLLQDVNLPELQQLFGESEQNSMVDSYRITPTQANYFQQQWQTAFDFKALDYFLECDAV